MKVFEVNYSLCTALYSSSLFNCRGFKM